MEDCSLSRDMDTHEIAYQCTPEDLDNLLIDLLLEDAYDDYDEYQDSNGICNIDPEGYLLIECAGSVLRVSSKQVSSMSSAFEGLIRLENTRSNSIPTSSSPLTLAISGSDDDPAAMEALMHLMHFSTIFSVPDMEHQKSRICCYMLDKLSFLADTYLCTSAIYYMTDSWTNKIASLAANLKDLDGLVLVAFRVKNNRQFFALTTRILNHNDSSTLDEVSMPDLRRLILQKRLQQDIARTKLITAVQKSFETLEKRSGDCLSEGNLKCTVDTRMIIHKRSLKKASLPIKPQLLRDCLVDKDYHELFSNAQNSDNHKCSAGKQCPLEEATSTLAGDLEFTEDLSSGITIEEFEMASNEPRW